MNTLLKTKNLTKILIVFLSCMFMLQLYLLYVKAANNEVVTIDKFNLTFDEGSSLRFQNSALNRLVTLKVVSGCLNGTDADLSIEQQGGQLTFIATNDSIVEVTHDFSQLTVNSVIVVSGGTATVNNGEQTIIAWVQLLEPLLPYMFIFGMVGFGCVFFGPWYFIYKFKQHEYRDAFVSLVIVMSLGIGFLLSWLV